MDWRIVIAANEWDKMWSYTELMAGEIACFGYTQLNEQTKTVYVDTLFLVPQTASPSEVDFMTDGLPYAIEKALNEGRIDDLRFCVHSHGQFPASWSTTDEDMIKKIGSTGTPWFASAIFNHEGASTGRIDIFGDTPFGKTQHNLKGLAVQMERDAQYDADRLDEIEEFVTVPAPPAPKAKKPHNAGTWTQKADGTWGPPTAIGTGQKDGEQDVFVFGKDEPAEDGDEDIFMVNDNTMNLCGTIIKLDEIPVAGLLQLAQNMGWQWCDDSTGSRYFWSQEHPIFFEVASERFDPTYTNAAHQYTDAAI